MNEIILQDVLRSHVRINEREVEERVLQAMKDAVIASIDLCKEKATIKCNRFNGCTQCWDHTVDKNSIEDIKLLVK